MKVKKMICDLCGGEIKPAEFSLSDKNIKVKIKGECTTRFLGLNEKEWRKLDICFFCTREIVEASRKKRDGKIQTQKSTQGCMRKW